MSPRAITILLLACASTACEGDLSGDPRPSRPSIPAPGKPFVVFLRDTLVIDRLEDAVDAPVTVGSTPSPGTLQSDSPEVVSVSGSGALIAHRNGSAIVRARETGSVLSVSVAAISRPLRAQPPVVRLRTGEASDVRIVDARGSDVPATAIAWASSAPDVATASNGVVRGGAVAGVTTLLATYGTERTHVRVEVESEEPPPLSIHPHAPSLRRGELVTFAALTAAGPLDAEWTSSKPRVASRLGGGVFRGIEPGEAIVCAVVSLRRACTKVEVRP